MRLYTATAVVRAGMQARTGSEIENLYLYHFPKGTLLKIEEDAQTAADIILTKVGDAIAAGVTEIDFRWPDRGCRHCPVAPARCAMRKNGSR